MHRIAEVTAMKIANEETCEKPRKKEQRPVP
jgi:hypothetical protein